MDPPTPPPTPSLRLPPSRHHSPLLPFPPPCWYKAGIRPAAVARRPAAVPPPHSYGPRNPPTHLACGAVQPIRRGNHDLVHDARGRQQRGAEEEGGGTNESERRDGGAAGTKEGGRVQGDRPCPPGRLAGPCVCGPNLNGRRALPVHLGKAPPVLTTLNRVRAPPAPLSQVAPAAARSDSDDSGSRRRPSRSIRGRWTSDLWRRGADSDRSAGPPAARRQCAGAGPAGPEAIRVGCGLRRHGGRDDDARNRAGPCGAVDGSQTSAYCDAGMVSGAVTVDRERETGEGWGGGAEDGVNV